MCGQCFTNLVQQMNVLYSAEQKGQPLGSQALMLGNPSLNNRALIGWNVWLWLSAPSPWGVGFLPSVLLTPLIEPMGIPVGWSSLLV